jgi:hypothetical protein
VVPSTPGQRNSTRITSQLHESAESMHQAGFIRKPDVVASIKNIVCKARERKGSISSVALHLVHHEADNASISVECDQGPDHLFRKLAARGGKIYIGE